MSEQVKTAEEKRQTIIDFINKDIRFISVTNRAELIADIITSLSSTDTGITVLEVEKVLEETKRIVLALVRI